MSERPKLRLFVAGPLAAGGCVDLSAAQAHKAANVLRLRVGAPVLLFNGRDGEWMGTLGDLGRGRGTAEVGAQARPQQRENGPWLAFAPLKKTATDFLVEKATELGVARLLPVITRRTNAERVNLDRLRACSLEAAEQCERLEVPECVEPRPLEHLLANWSRERRLIMCDESGGGRPLVDILRDEVVQNPSVPPVHGFLVGPEGGFERSELDALAGLPFVTRVGLGPRLLRAETAAIYALSCWQALAGEGRLAPRGL